MSEPVLFSPFQIKSKTLRNRVVLSPMCQYKAENGIVGDWHFQHYSRFAFSGLGAAFIEATGVSQDGRIGHGCTGIWNDEQISGMSKIVNVFKQYNCVSGIQLAHAGRKASFLRPWDGASPIIKDDSKEPAWQTIGPSAVPVNNVSPIPKAMTIEDIDRVKGDFIKSVWPENKPIFYRLSSVDGADGGATLDENVKLAIALKEAGVDVIDCSSGGIGGSPVLMKSKIIPGFQVPYSEKIKKEANISSMAVGAIINATQANDIILNNRADLVALGRELLADTQWVYKAATHFNLENATSFLPDSYSFYLSRRDEFLDRAAKPA